MIASGTKRVVVCALVAGYYLGVFPWKWSSTQQLFVRPSKQSYSYRLYRILLSLHISVAFGGFTYYLWSVLFRGLSTLEAIIFLTPASACAVGLGIIFNYVTSDLFFVWFNALMTYNECMMKMYNIPQSPWLKDGLEVLVQFSKILPAGGLLLVPQGLVVAYKLQAKLLDFIYYLEWIPGVYLILTLFFMHASLVQTALCVTAGMMVLTHLNCSSNWLDKLIWYSPTMARPDADVMQHMYRLHQLLHNAIFPRTARVTSFSMFVFGLICIALGYLLVTGYSTLNQVLFVPILGMLVGLTFSLNEGMKICNKLTASSTKYIKSFVQTESKNKFDNLHIKSCRPIYVDAWPRYVKRGSALKIGLEMLNVLVTLLCN